jgi:chromosome segregation ATPase
VARLRAELEKLKEANSAREFPPTPAVMNQMESGLKESQAELASLEARGGKLDEELKKLQAEAEEARKALDDYRKKYPLE